MAEDHNNYREVNSSLEKNSLYEALIRAGIILG